ncbi:hypothetical protein DFS33DRAFT_1482084 [Desarmillaria ectypa]|nr:hypothetical protein DFS33DRAFT_1482084 [Desarmillaria ectypa]
MPSAAGATFFCIKLTSQFFLQSVPLLSFAELCHSLNVPLPERQHRPLGPPSASIHALITSLLSILNIGPRGYQIIEGPPTLDQYWWLFQDRVSQGVANENNTFRDLRMMQGKSFRIYLHPIKGDQRSVIRVASTISFISADPADRALGLPGVSISRLLSKEPDILVNANNYFPSKAFGIVLYAIIVEITVIGHEKRAHTVIIPLEWSHAYITHLGLAHAVANGFHDVLSQISQPRPVHEKTLRLVALYSTDPSSQRWNAAYTIVNTKGSK